MVPAFLHSLISSFLETNKAQIVASVTVRFSGGSSELYFGFYETMFSDDEIKRLSKFLGVSVNYEHRNNKLNVSPKLSNISIALRNDIQSFYAETYDYCFENFEQTKLIWK